MRAAAVFVVTVVASGYGLVTGFKTEPVSAAWSGKADPEDGVSQVLTINFDELGVGSGAYVELFAGEYGGGGEYDLDILTYPGGTPIASKPHGKYVRPQHWVRFDSINVTYPESIVKGKKLEFRFTRGGADSIEYYYDENCGYGPYGQMIAPYPPPSLTTGLAMRCLGRMKPVDSTDFGACDLSWWASLDSTGSLTFDTAQFRQNVLDAKVRTVRFDLDWNLVQNGGETCWDWSLLDKQMRGIRADSGCRPLALLMQIATFASTRDDSVYRDSDGVWVKSPSLQCAPWGLRPVGSAPNPLARFIDAVVDHYDGLQMPIHDWEIWNEPNDTTSDSLGCYTDGRNGNFGWWRRPNIDSLYPDLGEGLPGLCSLYMRMAYVVDSVVKDSIRHPGHQHDKVAIGSVHRLFHGGGASGLVWGRTWLEGCYAATQNGVFWDAVSMHPYMEAYGNYVPFVLEDFENYAESLRCIMQAHGDSGERWNTEFSIPELCWWNHSNPPDTVTTEEQSANNCSEMFTLAEAMKGRPGGGFDRNYWWLLKQPFNNHGAWGLMRDDYTLTRNAEFYAFKQTAERLIDKRLNGRVTCGDTAMDDHARVYEFEDTTAQKIRTWVCWSDSLSAAVVAPVPVRSDTADTVALAYDESPPTGQKGAEPSGWARMSQQARPVFVTETGVASRPEIVTDSVWVVSSSPRPQVGTPATFCALLRNRDTQRSTPPGCSTWVRFAWNDSTICYTCTAESLGAGETLTVSVYDTVPPGMHGEGLLKADANPGMLYVEKEGTDDNQAYLRLDVLYPPSGGMDVVVPPLRKTPAPLLPIGLTSHSWERDSTGAQSTDSARALFVYYGQRDTVVHAADTTAWFPFCADTTLAFPRGSGVFRVYAQFRDSGENDSPFYPDSIDSVVVFDTTGPTGSIQIQGGSRFAPSSTCTLSLAAQDSASGVGWMRFINDAPKVDLVTNGGFSTSANSWDFENGEVDSLRMARLTVASGEAAVRQSIPAESISAHAGDSCALEASILAHVHEDDAAGGVSYWFYSIREDSLNFHDTLWELVDSACYSGELLSLTGRNGLSKHFLLEEPAPESGWVWRGGMVKVDANSENGTGSVWADDVRIVPYQSGSGYSWWNSYDTLVQWELESGAGMKVVHALYLDSAGNENATPYADTIILDPTAPVVSISLPEPGQYVGGTVEVTGWAYDPVEIQGDTFFAARRMLFRHVDSTNWLPVLPDSCSSEPAYPDSEQILGPAVHLGYWCTDSVPDGEYYIKLVGTDSAGHASSCSTWVIVFNSGGGGDFCGGPEGGGSGMGEGSLFIGSSTGAVLHLSDDLTVLDTFSVSDSGSQAYVTALLEVSNDSLLVLDAANKRIHKLHKNGQHRRRLVSNLSQPMDLKRDVNGNFWLVDKGWHRIGKFRSNGTLAFVRGGLGSDSLHFHSPEGIAVKGSLVYVADTKNDRICVWDTAGNYRKTITGDFESPTAVLPTDSGTIYLTDGSDGKLKGITPLGGNIVAIGTSDSSKLRGLVLSENEHSLFSIAPQPNKVYKLRIRSDESIPGGGPQSAGNVKLPKTLSLAQPFPNPARTRLNIAYALPHQTRVVLKLYDVAGKLVTTLANGEQKPGYYSLTWNRQDTKGRSCACGVYFCTLSADDKRFSRKVILTE